MPLLKSPAIEMYSRFSPDAKWIAYSSASSGTMEIYVEPFPPTGKLWKVSLNGGANPQWRADGNELFFASPDGKLMSASVTTSREFRSADHKALFAMPDGKPIPFGVTHDGQRFIVPVVSGRASRVVVITNWDGRIEPGLPSH
jgi:Tol biopolymer transport system component